MAFWKETLNRWSLFLLAFRPLMNCGICACVCNPLEILYYLMLLDLEPFSIRVRDSGRSRQAVKWFHAKAFINIFIFLCHGRKIEEKKKKKSARQKEHTKQVKENFFHRQSRLRAGAGESGGECSLEVAHFVTWWAHEVALLWTFLTSQLEEAGRLVMISELAGEIFRSVVKFGRLRVKMIVRVSFQDKLIEVSGEPNGQLGVLLKLLQYLN
jgi:hypothetical protein